jgi:hypothetical protein
MAQRVDVFEGVEFRYNDTGDTLISVCFGEWSFGVDTSEENGLSYPGGYPMNERWLDQVIARGKTGRELNDDMLIARQFCLDAYSRYLASLPNGGDNV